MKRRFYTVATSVIVGVITNILSKKENVAGVMGWIWDNLILDYLFVWIGLVVGVLWVFIAGAMDVVRSFRQFQEWATGHTFEVFHRWLSFPVNDKQVVGRKDNFDA